MSFKIYMCIYIYSIICGRWNKGLVSTLTLHVAGPGSIPALLVPWTFWEQSFETHAQNSL